MMDYKKYRRQYFLPPAEYTDWVCKDCIPHAPVWCSVDLRDGNQALAMPMTMQQKLSYFQLLVEVGFKEIEVGFPASSETEYRFVRTLIEKDLIPDDVRIQVLTQAREHIIRKTFEALRGAENAIVHVYNSISAVQREQVFGKSRDEICRIAVDGARLMRELNREEGTDYTFEYSPESFTAAEPEFALEVCEAVLDVWKPSSLHKAVINLPSTVQLSLPHVYASQVAYISRNLTCRDSVVLSLHPHNDRGTSVADAELGMLAGAQRIEGTLFGNGERAGNVDIVTLALNLYAQGTDPHLRFKDMNEIREKYEQCTGMMVSERSPYSNAMVFAAFSGSHQDAIAKSLKYRENHMDDPDAKIWKVPYLPIDPSDIGLSYDADVIRINSQSGKGGVSYILEQHYGLRLPGKMKEALGYAVKSVSDQKHKELQPEEIFALFKKQFENVTRPYDIKSVNYRQHNGIIAEVTAVYNDRQTVITASGNGRLNAVSNALKKIFPVKYDLVTYEEHALEKSSSARAIAYVGIKSRDTGRMYWGAGLDLDIILASVSALLTAVNNMAVSENVV